MLNRGEMMFDKVKVSLFVTVCILLMVSIGLIVYGVDQYKRTQQLQTRLNDIQIQLANAKTNKDTDQAEKVIKEFYMTVYNYERSQKEISMTTVKELATEDVYQELQNEIKVNNAYSPQQNTIQKSTLKANEIKVLAYKTNDKTQQYLVTAPIYQVFNGTKNDFELNQIVQMKGQRITKRTTLHLGGDER